MQPEHRPIESYGIDDTENADGTPDETKPRMSLDAEYFNQGFTWNSLTVAGPPHPMIDGESVAGASGQQPPPVSVILRDISAVEFVPIASSGRNFRGIHPPKRDR